MSITNKTSIQDSLINSSVQPYELNTCISWIAFIFVSFVICGSTYTGTIAMGVQVNLQEYFNIDNSQYNLLFTLGNLLKMFMPLVSGFLIDRIGYLVGSFSPHNKVATR